MKISIVTISFNQRKYLEQCIESVLSHKNIDLEYIVVDPGSNDGSRELIESYGNRILKVFESDAGPADGLNNGFRRATGEVFGFLNSDDYLCEGALEKVVNAFEMNPRIGMVVGEGVVDCGDGIKNIFPSPMNYRGLLYRYSTIFQQGTFFRKDVYEKSGGFNVKNKTCWDYELYMRMASGGVSHVLLAEQLAVFRLHEASISGSNRLAEQYSNDLDRIYEEYTGQEWGAGAAAIRSFGRAWKFMGGLARNLSSITK